MDLYDLSQQDIHFLEDKLSENPEILMKKDSVSEFCQKRMI